MKKVKDWQQATFAATMLAADADIFDIDENTTFQEAEDKFNELYARVCILAEAIGIKL